MNIDFLKSNYAKWLQSAHDYYWGDGTEDMMSDGAWDMLAKQYANNLSNFPFLEKHNLGSGGCYSLCTVKKQEFIDEIVLTSAF